MANNEPDLCVPISGIQKFTCLDFPGKLACIVFLAGCNLRCGYCHNPEFVLPEKLEKLKDSFIPEKSFFKFLEKRQGLLEGVVVSGGEPTIHKDLIDFIKRIKELGYLVKLDSNGSRPEVLRKILRNSLVDYIAIDVKTSPSDYQNLTEREVGKEILESIELIKSSGIDYEFRTTLIREVHDEKILEELGSLLKDSKKISLQKFRNGQTLDPRFQNYHAFKDEEMGSIAKDYFAYCI